MDRVKRIWYLSPMQAAKVQVSLRIRAVSPEPSLLAHTSSESRGTFRQKARSLAPPNGWAYAVKVCHDGMLEDTNSLDGAQIKTQKRGKKFSIIIPMLLKPKEVSLQNAVESLIVYREYTIKLLTFSTVMILSFRTDRPGQTVWTQGLHLPFSGHQLATLFYG